MATKWGGSWVFLKRRISSGSESACNQPEWMAEICTDAQASQLVLKGETNDSDTNQVNALIWSAHEWTVPCCRKESINGIYLLSRVLPPLSRCVWGLMWNLFIQRISGSGGPAGLRVLGRSALLCMCRGVFEQDADGKAADVGRLSGAEEQASPSQKTSCRGSLKDL